MTERCVLFVDIRLFHTLALQISAQDFVGSTWVHIVGTEQYPTLSTTAVFAHQIVNRRNRLLVRCCTCVEDVFAELFTFVLHGIEQQAVHFFNNRQNRLTRHRSPATEDHRYLVLTEQLLGFFCKQRPVRSWVNDHRLEFLAEYPALGVDLVNRHQNSVFQNCFRNGHRARQAVQDANFDRVSCQGIRHRDKRSYRQRCGCGQGFKISSTIHHGLNSKKGW